MQLRQLEYLIAVAEEANFTRAAERVHVSQSGVSAQIRRLEREVGATLIDRSGRTATLTAAGRAAAGPARKALDAISSMQRNVDEVTGLVRGQLLLGMVVGCRVEPLFDAVAAFHRAHPGVEVTLLEDESDRLVDKVRSRKLDLALVATAGAPPDNLSSLPIVEERLIAAVSRTHSLANRRRISLRELCDHPLVTLPLGTGIRTAFERDCATLGRRPTVAFEASSPETIADLAARGLGVAVLSPSTVEPDDHALRVLQLSGAPTPAVLCLAWGSASNPALDAMVAGCRRSFSV